MRVATVGLVGGWWVMLLLGTGCYYYEPVAVPAPRPGAYLSLALTDSGTTHFWPYLGPDVGAVRGRLIDSDDRRFTLSVLSVGLRHGQELYWKGETVQLPREYVAFLQERRLSTGRTLLTAGASITAFVALLSAVTHSGIGSGRPGGGGPPR
ncbi:MAG TPA: hypothetical protein VN908_08810 [Gemmatimonadales bacterium]|nr:hypothetical protein [Gemmatimonadales bacterium]